MKKRIFSFLAVLAAGAFLLSAGCIQGPPGSAAPEPVTAAGTATDSPAHYTSNETLIAFVHSAVEYAKTNGKEKALAEFSNPNGSFIRGELYIYAYDFNGTTLAHPVNPEKIGVNRLNETAGNIGLILQNMSAVAARGGGFYRFYYINPAHNRTVESKLGYSEKVDDNWWLGSGVYTGPKEPVTQ
jgi:hypothetical protein